jgi:serine/threonine protein kinase
MVKDNPPHKSPYQIMAKIGHGVMGIVYKSEDMNQGREVALKFLPGDLVANTQKKQRFIREARAAAALNHPNIATLYGIQSGWRVVHRHGTVQGSDPSLAVSFLMFCTFDPPL